MLNNNNTDKNTSINIGLYSCVGDVLELKIYFYDENKMLANNRYFSSALSIKGRKETIAKIPIKVEEKMFFKIILYSSNFKGNIVEIMFPVYPKESSFCSLNRNNLCISKYPSKVSYRNGKIEENYEKISLIAYKDVFYSYDNLIPIQDIKILSDSKKNYGVASLILKENIESFNIYYDNCYRFSLDIKEKDNISFFDFSNKYYIDFLKGVISETHLKNAVFDNNVLLPYKDKEYELILEIEGYFSNFSVVQFNFIVNTEGELIGECKYSKYCIRRSYV